MIKRRSMLAAAVAAGGVAAGWRYAYRPGVSSLLTGPEQSLFVDGAPGAGLLDFLAPMEEIGPVGEAWLTSLEQEPNMAELLQSVMARTNLSAADLESVIAGQVRREFSIGDTCSVKGWQLSLTECQLGGLRQLAIARGLIIIGQEQQKALAGHTDIYTAGEIAPLENWGPRHTVQGKKFNEQLDGHSGLWFKVRGAPAHAKIMIDGEISKTSVSEKVVSSGLFDEMQERILSTPGTYEIALVDPIRKIKQAIGKFEVRGHPLAAQPAVESAVEFCQVESWGPRKTRVGVAANEQADGSMGIWVRTSCLPVDTQLLFADDPLPVKRRSFGLTAAIPLAFLGAPGQVAVTLYNPASGQRRLIGHVIIE